MKTLNFLFAAAVGAFGYHVWMKSTKKAMGQELSAEQKLQIATDVITEDSQEFSEILRKQFDFIRPPKASAKARARGKELTEGRFAIDLNKVKEPVKL